MWVDGCLCLCMWIGISATCALEVEVYLCSAEMQRSTHSGASACDDVTETLMPPIARSSRGTLTLLMPILRHFLQLRPADLLLYETLVALGGPCSRKWVLIRFLLSRSVVFQ